MDEKVIIENFDFIINNLTARNGFSINNELFDKFKPESTIEREYFLDLCDEIKDFGLSNGYLLQLGKPANNSGYFNLTEKGLDLKKFGKGHKKFTKKLKKEPLTKYQKIYLTFFIIFGLVAAYGVFRPSLTKYNSVESNKDNKEKVESKSEKINDSLRPKNYTDSTEILK